MDAKLEDDLVYSKYDYRNKETDNSRSGTYKKDVLGLWVGATESSKYWIGVRNSLKNRDVSDILLVPVDGLSGFSDAISVAFPKTEIQRCILHQIRSSTRYVSYKD